MQRSTAELSAQIWYTIFVQNYKKSLKTVTLIFYTLLLIFPILTVWETIGTFENLQNTLSHGASSVYLLLRLTGLYAFVLLFLQIMHGAFMPFWNNIFGPKSPVTHEKVGIIIYILILFHPFFYIFSVGMELGFIQALPALLPKINTEYELHLTYGKVALTLLTLSVLAVYFRHLKILNKHWIKFHVLNYVVFFLAFYHSYKVGSDSHLTPYSYLYPAMFLGVVGSIVYRFLPRVKKHIRLSS